MHSSIIFLASLALFAAGFVNSRDLTPIEGRDMAALTKNESDYDETVSRFFTEFTKLGGPTTKGLTGFLLLIDILKEPYKNWELKARLIKAWEAGNRNATKPLTPNEGLDVARSINVESDYDEAVARFFTELTKLGGPTTKGLTGLLLTINILKKPYKNSELKAKLIRAWEAGSKNATKPLVNEVPNMVPFANIEKTVSDFIAEFTGLSGEHATN